MNWCLQYDKNHSGALEFEELHAVLADLGILVRHCSVCTLSSVHSGLHHITLHIMYTAMWRLYVSSAAAIKSELLIVCQHDP